MNILHRITKKSLGMNPTRTWVTIIGILLSMALVVAVLEGAYSGLQFMAELEKKSAGAYHGFYYGLDKAQAEAAAGQKEIESSAKWQTVGWEQIGTVEENRYYLFVDAMEPEIPSLVSIRLLEGRMPENDRELLLPSDLFSDASYGFSESLRDAETVYAVGTRHTLMLGTRTDAEGNLLHERDDIEEGERVIDAKAHDYTVVGIYRGLGKKVDGRYGSGYRALTVGEGSGAYTTFFTVKHPTFYRGFAKKQAVSGNLENHDALLRYYGAGNDGANINGMLYGFAAILVALIAFGSISLIYNSFSISVAERTRQFGILKSVGATKKQIRSMVLYEALLLGFAGILLGTAVGLLGIGITLWALSPSFARLLTDIDAGVRMRLVVSVPMLAVSALVCLVTTLISAWIPAKRAVRINAIDAVRQSADVKIRPREVKTSRLTGWLFGFEGTMASKNFKRNRKRYRSTVLSLFLSIVLFISASSFTSYLKDSIGGIVGGGATVDILCHYYGEKHPDEILRLLKSADTVTEGMYFVSRSRFLQFDEADLASDYKAQPDEVGVTADRTEAMLLFVDDATFRKVCAENRIDADAFFADEAKALVPDRITKRVRTENGFKWYTFKSLQENRAPMTARMSEQNPPEGYVFLSERDWIFGEEELRRFGKRDDTVVLIEEAAFKELLYADSVDTEKVDTSRMLVLPKDEVYRTTTLPVQAVIDADTVQMLPNDTLTLLYPYSRMDEVIGKESDDLSHVTVYLWAGNHSAATKAMFELLEQTGEKGSWSVFDLAESREMERMLIGILNVFAYGFIILISLIAAANVFNTISTNILLRRREFAMLKSIGLSDRGLGKMMNYECLIYGLKGILWGLPAAIGVTYLIWRAASSAVESSFYVPWQSVVIAVGSVFAVVFATMLYAMRRIRRDNPIDALKNENM